MNNDLSDHQKDALFRCYQLLLELAEKEKAGSDEFCPPILPAEREEISEVSSSVKNHDSTSSSSRQELAESAIDHPVSVEDQDNDVYSPEQERDHA